MGAADPDPPLVPPEAYDEPYYRDVAAGAAEWTASQGARADPMYDGYLDVAEFLPGQVLVDVGCGRGELLAVAAARGAGRAIGVEYSAAGVTLSRRTLEAHAAGDRAEVLAADARAIPLPDATADLVTMLEVVEHLAPGELEAALSEALRILRPGGRLLVHTMPNRTIFALTYRLQRSLLPWRRRAWPANPRTEHERQMHVNEQTVGSLRRVLRRAGFADVEAWLGRWVRTDFVPGGRPARLYERLAAFPATRRLGVADVWARARRPG